MLPRHLPVLDGLRAIAVLLVLWSHVPNTTPGYPVWLDFARVLVEPGGLGVEIFFVLSGFLITRILIAERRESRPVRWFLLRRVLRIFPIYYLLLAIMLVVDPRPEIAWCAVYLSNVVTILHPERMFPLQHTWSLCIEEHFYLLWPLVVAFTAESRPVRILLFVVMPAAITAAFLVGIYGGLPNPYQAVQHASPIRFFSLGAGCLLACTEPSLAAAPRRFGLLAAALLAFGCATNGILQYLLLPRWLATEPLLPPAAGPGLWLLSNCSLATGLLLVCLVGGDRRWSPVRALRWSLLRGVGRISYGLYLYHLPIFRAVVHPAPSGSRALAAVALAFAAATASYWIVERPILRYGRRLR